MIVYPALEPYAESYGEIVGETLTVRALLVPGSRLAGYDPLCLDDLLAWAVVHEATEGAGLPPTQDAYALPVPLRCLWREPETGLPLWAATPFLPAGPSVPDVSYWHKRAQTGRYTGAKSGTFAITATAGRWMERRVPLPTLVCDELVADCEGEPREIARLLRSVTHLGKRRSMNACEVREWVIESRAEPFALVESGRLTRPVPARCVTPNGTGLLEVEPDEAPGPVGWTPAQWNRALWRAGWREGTRVGGSDR